MFGKNRNSRNKTARGDLTALIGKGVEFTGKLSFQGMVRIDGRFKGEISTEDTLIIGEDGEVEANMSVGVAVVMGLFRGNISAKSKLEVSSTGKLYGNISTPTLAVEPGAVFEGNCRMENLDEAEREMLALSTPITAEAAEAEPQEIG